MYNIYIYTHIIYTHKLDLVPLVDVREGLVDRLRETDINDNKR